MKSDNDVSQKKFKYLVNAYALLNNTHYISEDEKLEELKTFIDKIPINRKIQTSGSTLLNYAIYNEYYKIGSLLIENGADVSLKDDCQYYKPIIYNLNKKNIALTNLLLKNSNTPKDDLCDIINHCFKFDYTYMLIYAINQFFILEGKNITTFLSVNSYTKINNPPEKYERIFNYPTLCLEFNPSYYKYYPKNTREKIIFIIWVTKNTNIVLPLELVFLILQNINLVLL